MRRLVPIAGLIALLAFAGSASASGTVVASGNFHVPGKAIGWHYVEYGPVSVALPASATIRCERYSDKTFVAVATSGTVTKSHKGAAVAAGPVAHQGGWTRRFSAKLTCTAMGWLAAAARSTAPSAPGTRSGSTRPPSDQELTSRAGGVAAARLRPVSCSAP